MGHAEEYAKLSQADKDRWDKYIPWLRTYYGYTEESHFEFVEAGGHLIRSMISPSGMLCLGPLIIRSGPDSIENGIERIVGCAVGNGGEE